MPAEHLTHDQARDLLTAAAGTIDVDTFQPQFPAQTRRWPLLLALAGVAAATALIVLAATLPGPWREDGPRPVSTPDPTPTITAEPVEVPWVLQLRAIEAEEALVVAGLRATIVRRAKCEHPIVGSQDPQGGTTAPPETPIALRLVCPSDATGTERDLTRISEQFVSFAKGAPAVLPVDGPVDLYLGGRRVTTAAARTDLRETWTVCPASATYAGRDCPFSALDVLRDPDDLSITPTPSQPCASWTVPSELTRYQHTSITVGASCVDWAAVTLYVDEKSRLVAVDLTMAEP